MLSAPNKTRLQEIIGSLIYFARCIDSRILSTLGVIGTNIADGTERVAVMATYLLIFFAANRNPSIQYYASDMILCGHTDALHLLVSKARS